MIPRRVGNLTPKLCDVTDDLLNYLSGMCIAQNGHIDDLTPIMTKWAFQSMSNIIINLYLWVTVFVQLPLTLCLERILMSLIQQMSLTRNS